MPVATMIPVDFIEFLKRVDFIHFIEKSTRFVFFDSRFVFFMTPYIIPAYFFLKT